METLYQGGSADGSLSTYESSTTNEVVRDPHHSFEVSEAVRLGSVEKALILKEITRMSVYKVRMGKEPWVFYSGKMLSEKFPYMAQRSVERWMRELEEAGELVSCIRNKMRYDKTKSYTIPHFESIHAQNGESSARDGEPIPPLSTPLSNNTSALEDEPRGYERVKENAEEPRSRKKPKYPHALEVFALWGKYPANWKMNTTELRAAENLYAEQGIEDVKEALAWYHKHKSEDFCPRVNSPYDLDAKWTKLQDYSLKN